MTLPRTHGCWLTRSNPPTTPRHKGPPTSIWPSSPPPPYARAPNWVPLLTLYIIICEPCLLCINIWVTPLIHLYISHVFYTSIHKSSPLYFYIRVMSLICLHISHISYIFIYASRLVYIYIWVMSFMHLYMSRASYIFIHESRPLYVYIWVVSLTHLYMSHVPYTPIHESCLSS